MTTDIDRRFRLPLQAHSTLGDVLIINGDKSIVKVMQLRLGGAIVRDRTLYSLILSPVLEQVRKKDGSWLCGRSGLRFWHDDEHWLHASTASEDWIHLFQRWGAKEIFPALASSPRP